MSLTDAAAERARQLLAKNPDALALRIGVKKGGCAGMEYTVDYASEIGKFDDVVEDKGVRIVVDPMAIMYLIGTEMDYRVDKLASQFVFNNPNQTSACGCGESVELKPADKDRLEALKS
jgi:iron-sulfur cluster assembly protein